jgi:hypothetical protein
MDHLLENDVKRWCDDFLEDLVSDQPVSAPPSSDISQAQS